MEKLSAYILVPFRQLLMLRNKAATFCKHLVKVTRPRKTKISTCPMSALRASTSGRKIQKYWLINMSAKQQPLFIWFYFCLGSFPTWNFLTGHFLPADFPNTMYFCFSYLLIGIPTYSTKFVSTSGLIDVSGPNDPISRLENPSPQNTRQLTMSYFLCYRACVFYIPINLAFLSFSCPHSTFFLPVTQETQLQVKNLDTMKF